MWASAPTAVGRSTSVERGWSCVARHIRRIDPCIWSGQRQRRGRRDDPTFHAPCKIHQPCGTHPNNLKRAGRAKGFLNRRFKRRFLHTFCRCWQKVCHQRHNAPIPLPSYQKQTKNRRGLIAAPIFILSLPAFWSCRSAEESSSSHAHTRSGRAARDTRCSLSDRRAPT